MGHGIHIQNPENSRQVHRFLELLAGVATDSPRFKKPDLLLRGIWQRISSQTKADVCLCYSVRGRRLQLFFWGGIDEVPSQLEQLAFGEGACGIAARDRHSLYMGDIQSSCDPSLGMLREIGLHAVSCIPLLSDSSLVGALAFGTRQALRFEAEELDLQRAVAHQLAIALDRMFLMQKLAGNNRKLAAANAGLKRANADLEQFAFSTSHDLREPIRHLSIYTEILRRKLDGQLDDDARQCLRFVLLSARKLEMLVTDLLAYTSVVMERPAEIEVDTNAVLARVLGALQSTITETAAVVRATDLPALRMNEGHLAELFQQILQNALKFRRADVAPEIDISCHQNAGGTVVCVRDNGIGIETQHQDLIFGLFKRLYSSERYQGTGIGLAICRKIVERYNGQIWVESEFGNGALFCFRLGAGVPAGKSRAAHGAR